MYSKTKNKYLYKNSKRSVKVFQTNSASVKSTVRNQNFGRITKMLFAVWWLAVKLLQYEEKRK